MRGLTLRFKKKSDGAVAISYVRPDGSATWATGATDTARFFAHHDLGHYAVETTLGLRRAFLGLLADGWDLDDFGSPWPRGKFAPEDIADLMLAEFLAGALDGEPFLGGPLVAAEFNRMVHERCTEREGTPCPRPITDDELAAVRARRSELVALWARLPMGETLELSFR